MAALSSYTPIATYTVPSGTPISYTFTSIPQTYTDLILVTSFAGNYPSNDRSQLGIQVGNGSVDTGSNYSVTSMTGNGSTATSSRTTSSNQLSLATFPLGPSSSLQQNNLTVHFQNYSNTTTNKTVLARATQMNSSNNTPSTVAEVGLWRSTSAIDTIKIKDYSDLYYFYAGTTFSLYGIANTAAGAKATGGFITSDSDYFYHTFYSTGTFTPTQSLSCDYLVVAGGGGGGHNGGGGGAGGFRTSIGGSPLSVTATGYTITVGAGGAGGTTAGTSLSAGQVGSNSVFSSITSTGGGGGGTGYGYNPTSGGSGGGAQTQQTGGAASPSGQGNAGGNGGTTGGLPYATGGGGGAGAVGANGNDATSTSGNGGIGLTSTLNAQSLATYYAGGGGGAGYAVTTVGTGGTGGGGNAGTGSVNPQAGIANTGGGGGGDKGATYAGGAGGSGVVIIRYAR